VLASIFTLVTFMHTGAGQLPNQVYLILQASVTVIWCLSMILLFSDIFLVRRAFPAKFEEVRVSHPNVLYAGGIIGICASIMGIIVTFWSPWNPDLFTRTSWIYWLIIVTAASALVAIVIYGISEMLRRRERPAHVEAPTG
jgi:hypothetical protein